MGDTETAAGSLTLSGSSSNPALVPPSGIVFAGSGASRTVTVTPAANQSGSATITVSVSDGALSANDTFLLTVTAVNDGPTVSDLTDQAIPVNTSTGAIVFTVGDIDTPAGSLTLSGSSSNPVLVPLSGIVFGGSGASRTVTVTPATDQFGTATITVTVSDGALTAIDTFVLTVTATPVAPLAFAQSNGVFGDASGTTLTVQLTGVQAGSLLVAYVKWEGTAASTVSLSDGTSVFTADTLNSAANGDLHGRFYYLPAAGVSGTVNYTATWSAARPYRRLMIYEYRYGGTVSVDGATRATGTSGSLATGNLTTTGTDEVVFGAYGEYGPNNTTNERIGGVVADQVLRVGYAAMWSKTFSSPVTGAATATGNSSTWIGNLIAFKNDRGPDTQSPSAPGSLAATSGSSSQINLGWIASNDNDGVTGYLVERCQGVECSSFAPIGTTTSTTGSDTGLVASTSYSYRVRATDAAGNLSSYSSTASATTAPPDSETPSAPGNLAATAVSSNQINLSWSASIDNVGVSAYQVERCEGGGCSVFVPIRTTAGTSVIDARLTAGTSYSYRVLAVDASGNSSPYSSIASATSWTSNPIVVENLQPGSGEWKLGFIYERPYATDAGGQIKGYASAPSVNKGESINLYVSVNPPQTYTIDVYRIGWYQGLGGRLMQHAGPLNGVTQPTPLPNPATGLLDCNWAPSYVLNTETSWTTGIYLAVLRNAQNFHNYIIFTVRDDSRVGAFLYQQPVTTAQAYNAFPEGTGKSLYEHNSGGVNTLAGTKRAVKVSFDRPYGGRGDGQFLELSEINTLRWLERSGYDVTYSTDVDTHRDGSRLLNHRGFLSLPHDEYWSKQMYDAAVAARNSGVNLAFFGANSVFWQIRFEPSVNGVADRVIICYKDANLDPITDPNLETVTWRDAPVSRPEQTLMGVQFTDGPNSGTASYVVANSSHWVYAGTGFVDGQIVPGIVWYESDRLVAEDPPPVAVSATHTLLSHSPYVGSGNNSDYNNASIYQAPSGAWVFASGTMGWGWGLDDFYPEGSVNTVDVRIQRTTANILNRFIGP